MRTPYDEPEATAARLAVYGALRELLTTDAPQPVKLDVIARVARVRKATAGNAIGWLILRGYVVLHERGHRGMAVVTLAKVA